MAHIPSLVRKVKSPKFENLKQGFTKISSSLNGKSINPPSLPPLDEKYNTFIKPTSINFETFKGYLPQLKHINK